MFADDDPALAPGSRRAEPDAALAGAVRRVIQLRAKHATDGQMLAWARALRELTRRHGARLVVNDRFDLALAAEADAVHLGQTDLPPDRLPAHAREALCVGRSTHTLDQLETALREPVDYLAYGPVFGTRSKESEYDERGLERLAEMAAATDARPLVAIGGITAASLAEVVRAGADGAAVISAVAAARDPEQATRELVAIIDAALAERGETGRGRRSG